MPHVRHLSCNQRSWSHGARGAPYANTVGIAHGRIAGFFTPFENMMKGVVIRTWKWVLLAGLARLMTVLLHLVVIAEVAYLHRVGGRGSDHDRVVKGAGLSGSGGRSGVPGTLPSRRPAPGHRPLHAGGRVSIMMGLRLMWAIRKSGNLDQPD